MFISEIINHEPEDETKHFAAMKRTGFYGEEAAGCVFLAPTGRIALALRSAQVAQRHTWGTIGGAINPGENPKIATIREAEEEVGYALQSGDYLIPLDLFQSGTFKYSTFLYVVNQEFRPHLNWEADDFGWFDLTRLPQPLHFGIAGTLQKPQCVQIIQTEISKHQQKSPQSA